MTPAISTEELVTTLAPALAGAWNPAEDLPVAAAWYGQHDDPAVLAETGNVLVAGGADAAGTALRDSAVFDVEHGTWQPAGALGTPRQLHTVTALPDGRVLVTGGLNAAGVGLDSAEIYNPRQNSWAPTQPMSEPRWGHSAVVLPNGSVLIAGGTTVRSGQTRAALRTAERFAPGNETWSTAGTMTDARTGHTAVALAHGAVLVCGGTAPVGTADDPALAFCELYDADGNSWTPTGSLLRARRRHQATRLSDRKVLVTGGTAPGSPGAALFDPFSQRTAELFDLGSGAWTAAADMPAGRALHCGVPLGSGQALVVGGAASDRNEAGYRSAATYDVGPNRWTAVTGLRFGRWAFAAVALPDGRVLVTGGVSRSGLAAADPDVTELTRATELFTRSGS
jgi:hypothetical protein